MKHSQDSLGQYGECNLIGLCEAKPTNSEQARKPLCAPLDLKLPGKIVSHRHFGISFSATYIYCLPPTRLGLIHKKKQYGDLSDWAIGLNRKFGWVSTNRVRFYFGFSV